MQKKIKDFPEIQGQPVMENVCSCKDNHDNYNTIRQRSVLKRSFNPSINGLSVHLMDKLTMNENGNVLIA